MSIARSLAGLHQPKTKALARQSADGHGSPGSVRAEGGVKPSRGSRVMGREDSRSTQLLGERQDIAGGLLEHGPDADPRDHTSSHERVGVGEVADEQQVRA